MGSRKEMSHNGSHGHVFRRNPLPSWCICSQEPIFTCTRVYFAGIAKIRDYFQYEQPKQTTFDLKTTLKKILIGNNPLHVISFLHKSQQPLRPLPQPPKGGLPGGDLPASRSPRARRRYKVTSSSHAARSHYVEEEEEEDEDDEDKSTASESRCRKIHLSSTLTHCCFCLLKLENSCIIFNCCTS